MAVREEILRGGGQVGQAAALPGADANAFGAGLGRAAEQVGGELHAAKVRQMRLEQQRQEEAETSAAMVGLAEFSRQADEVRNKDRDEAPIDGSGHATRVAGEVQGLGDTFLETIGNERVRNRIAPHVASTVGRIAGDEDGWARGRRAKAIGIQAVEAADNWASQHQNNPDPAALETSLAAGEEFINTVASDKPALAQDLRKQWQQTVAIGFARGLTEKDPAAAAALLEAGTIDGLIGDPDKKAALLNEAQTAQRMAEADARRLQAAAEAQLREQVTIFKQGLTAGNEPDDKEFDALLGQAKSLGLDAVVTELELERYDLGVRRKTRNWTAPEWQSAIGELQAKGDKRTAADDIKLKALERLRPGALQKLGSNPQEWAAGAGMPAPQVDVFGEPSSQEIDSLRAWAKAARQTGGLSYTPYLNPQQEEAARVRIREGAVGALGVATQLSNLFGVADAAEIVRRLDPNNRDLQLMVGLHPSIASRYGRGVDALKRNNKLFDADTAREVFAEFAGAIPQEMRTPIFDAAKNIAAGTADWVGAAELQGDEFEAAFKAAIQRAAGQLGAGDGSGTGGFGTWNDRKVWLPRDMGGPDFARRVSRAGPKQWIAAGGGKPHYQGPNGKLTPIPDDWFQRFKRAPLVTVRPGVYRPLGRDGGILRHANGHPWEFDIRRLPR